jgi:hypothetical protein
MVIGFLNLREERMKSLATGRRCHFAAGFFAGGREMQICANLRKFMQSRAFACPKTCKILQKPAKCISESSINRQLIAGLGRASGANSGFRLNLESSSEMFVGGNEA